MNEELKKIGKNGAAELLYHSNRDGLSSETLWKKCENHNETITLVQTDFNSVIGFYCSEKFENTTNMKTLRSTLETLTREEAFKANSGRVTMSITNALCHLGFTRKDVSALNRPEFMATLGLRPMTNQAAFDAGKAAMLAVLS